VNRLARQSIQECKVKNGVGWIEVFVSVANPMAQQEREKGKETKESKREKRYR
jgi:hypothetical protein